jgi:UDP-N-acetylglucosamine:LPS N-acetylglucosamine transferase
MLLRSALDRYEVTFATTDGDMAARDGLSQAWLIDDCNRHNKAATIRAARKALAITRAVRPQVVLSTGALPGLLCIAAGRLVGARTIWIDSIANSERLSGSGRFARLIADRCLTQWEHLAVADRNLRYAGSLL